MQTIYIQFKAILDLLKSPCFLIQLPVNFHETFKITFIIVQIDPESLKYKYIISSNSKLICASWESVFFKYILLLINFHEISLIARLSRSLCACSLLRTSMINNADHTDCLLRKCSQNDRHKMENNTQCFQKPRLVLFRADRRVAIINEEIPTYLPPKYFYPDLLKENVL